MTVTDVSTRFHKRHTMSADVGQTSTMDTWVTWAYNDVFMYNWLMLQKVSKPLTEFQSFHDDTDFNFDLRLLTSYPHCMQYPPAVVLYSIRVHTSWYSSTRNQSVQQHFGINFFGLQFARRSPHLNLPSPRHVTPAQDPTTVSYHISTTCSTTVLYSNAPYRHCLLAGPTNTFTIDDTATYQHARTCD
jgi:hypothetical protein